MVAFSSLAKIFGECSTIHSLPAVFLFCFFFLSLFLSFVLFSFFLLLLFFEVEVSSRAPIPLFIPFSVHSGSAR